MPSPDWISVAPTWERNPDDREIWRRVVVMPSLALNRVELEFLGSVPGKSCCVITVADGMAPLALAAMGGRVTVIDPTNGALDVLVVRAQLVGVELQYTQCELKDLRSLSEQSFHIVYAGQATGQVADIDGFYAAAHRLLTPGGRLVMNEYHPVRRIWKLEPGSPRLLRSYFDRRRPRTEAESEEDISDIGSALDHFRHNWTVADHLNALKVAGFRLVGLEEVGDTRQQWETPNLSGLPEQLVICGEKPA